MYYFYTDTIDNAQDFEKYILEIFILADKYFVNSLKEICELMLVNQIDIDNINDLFLISRQYNSKMLEKYTVHMIRYYIVKAEIHLNKSAKIHWVKKFLKLIKYF